MRTQLNNGIKKPLKSKKEISPSKDFLRDGNVIMENLLDKDLSKIVLKKRKRRKRTKLNPVGLDSYIHSKKWYAGTFNQNSDLIIIPMGWHYKSIARDWWRYRLRIKKLGNHVLFFKGDEVIQKGYQVKAIYHFNGKTKYLRSRMIFPPDVSLTFTRKRFKQKLIRTLGFTGKSKKTEKPFFRTLMALLPDISDAPYNRQNIINYKRSNIKHNHENNTPHK